MESYETYRSQLDDWLTRLAYDVSTEIHLVSTEQGVVKEGHDLLLDRPLPELVPHPNPLAMPADFQHGVLVSLRFSKEARKSQAGYAIHTGEVKWHDVITLNGHVLLFLLGDLEHRAYTIKPQGMSLEAAVAKRHAALETITPDEEGEPAELDEDF